MVGWQQVGDVVRLEATHLPSIAAFLGQAPIENVLLIDRLIEDGLPGRLYQEFVGYHEGADWLGVAYFSGDISLYIPGTVSAPHDRATERTVTALATYALERQPLVPRVIGRKETVDAFWALFTMANLPLRFDRAQTVYVLGRNDLQAPNDPDLRLAVPLDCEQVAMLASAMSQEEIQMDPLAEHPMGYRRLIDQRIRQDRYYVLEDAGLIRFQVQLNAVTPQAAQVTGVYTPPEDRRQGYARRGMAALCHQALERSENLTLFVNDFNDAANGLYRALGFRPVMSYRAVFMAEPRQHPSWP